MPKTESALESVLRDLIRSELEPVRSDIRQLRKDIQELRDIELPHTAQDIRRDVRETMGDRLRDTSSEVGALADRVDYLEATLN